MVHFVDSGGESETLAPVTPLFGRRGPALPAPGATAPNPPPPQPPATRTPPLDGIPRFDTADDDHGGDGSDDTGGEVEREIAERNLLRKLRSHSLSVIEARAVVAERALPAETVEAVLDAFIRRGYLDDAAFAEQLVHAGVDRKGQGRRAIAQTLAKRGVPRDLAEAALAALPDDDAERALEFARTKARSMRSLDRDTALRRLTGQLARRGYGGSAAVSAARQALDECR